MAILPIALCRYFVRDLFLSIFKIRADICSDFDYTIFNQNWRLNGMKQLGMRLRTLREGIGLSQSKFADVIGSTQSSINRYENGQATPTVELLHH